MRNRIIGLIFKNYMVLLTILVSVELLGHFSYRIYKGYYLFENGKKEKILFLEHPYLAGVPKQNFELKNVSGTIKIGTDQLGNRVSYSSGMQHHKNAQHIVCLGGSSTFATGVNDADSWPYLLQDKLGPGYKVTNLGVPGYSTQEAIIQMGSLVQSLKPDIIINYQGWNDLRNYHLKKDKRMYLEHGLLQRNNLKVAKKSTLVDYSFIYFISQKIRSRIIKSSRTKTTYPETDSETDSIYAQNLKTLKTLGKSLGSKQIFVPQVLNMEWYAKNIQNPWTPTIPNKNMPKLLRKFNDIMSVSLKEEEDKDLIVIDSILYLTDWENRHFVDEGHFSKLGGEIFAQVLVGAIHEFESQKNDSIPIN